MSSFLICFFSAMHVAGAIQWWFLLPKHRWQERALVGVLWPVFVVWFTWEIFSAGKTLKSRSDGGGCGDGVSCRCADAKHRTDKKSMAEQRVASMAAEAETRKEAEHKA